MMTVFLACVYVVVVGLIALTLLATFRVRFRAAYVLFTPVVTFLTFLAGLLGLVSGVILLAGGTS